MHEIDALREKARRLSDASRDCSEGMKPFYRAKLYEVEEQIDKLLMAHIALPNCPFCRLGKMVKTPTEGRLACDRCRAIGLEGWWHGK